MTLPVPLCRTSLLGACHRPAPPASASLAALSRSISSGDIPSNGSTSSDTAKFLCRWSRSAPASIATRALSSRSSRSIRFRSLFRVSFIHAYLPAKPNTTTTPAVKRAFAQRGMTLSSSTLISTWENRGLLHAWTRFAAIRSACAGNEDAGKEGGIQSRFRRGELRQRAPCTSRSLKGSPRLRGSRGGITVTRRTSARRAAAPLSSGALLVVSSALALVVTRATAPLGIQRLFRVISKLPTLPRRGAFSTAA